MAGYHVNLLSEAEEKEKGYDSFEATVYLDEYLKFISAETGKNNLMFLAELLEPVVYLYSQLMAIEEE